MFDINHAKVTIPRFGRFDNFAASLSVIRVDISKFRMELNLNISGGRCNTTCFPIRDLTEIWGNVSDHDANDFSLWPRKIRPGVFELEKLPQN
jgi:hypothetical protein